jgi:hypothetical protein
MRNTIALIVLLLIPVGCQPGSQPEAALDVEGAEQQVRAEAQEDDVRDAMMRVIQLEPAQRTALEQAYMARDEEFGAWLEGEKGKRLVALEARMRIEAKESNLAEFRKVIAEATPLRNELIGMLKSHQQNILDTLSPSQQLQWAGYEVSSTMLELMVPLQLVPGQVSAIEGAAVEAVAQATQRGEPNPKAAAFLDLEQWVEESVLSAEQHDGYQDVKDANKMRSLGI